MMYIGVGMIWIGYAIAVCGVAFGTKNADVTRIVGILGAFFAALASGVIVFHQ